MILVGTAFGTTTTTGTIQYPDGSAFANGTVKAIFTPPTGIQDQNLYKFNGASFPYEVTGTMDASGHFSIALTDDHLVSPVGGRWNFVLCSVASIPCNQSLQDVFGASIDLGGLINADIATQQNVSGTSFPLPIFYSDTEAQKGPNGGGTYFNFTSKTARLFNGSTWNDIGGGGSGTVTSFAVNCAGVAATILNCNVVNPTTTPTLTLTSPLSLSGNTSVLVTKNGASTSTHCASWDASGNLQDTGSACGGAPATPLTGVQFNNGGVFGADSYFTFNINTKNLTLASLGLAKLTDAYIWTASPSDDLSSAGAGKTVTFTTCPRGLNVLNLSRIPFKIYIDTVGTPEAALVTGGTCTPAGGSAGTLVITTQNAHTAGYHVNTAYDGIQEALNDAIVPNATAVRNGPGAVIISPTPPPTAGTVTGHNIYASIILQGSNVLLSGYGSDLNCRPGTYLLRGPCLIVGEPEGDSDNYRMNIIQGLTFRPPTNMSAFPEYQGSLITSTERTAGVITINTSAAHGYKTGDRIIQKLTDSPAYWGDVPSVTVVDADTYTYTRTNGIVADIPAHTGPGITALAYVAVLDNSASTKYYDVKLAHGFISGKFNAFFDAYDNEDMDIDGLIMVGGLNYNANWFGEAVWAGGESNAPDAAFNMAPVITLRQSSLTNVIGVTDYTGNGLFIENTVIQAQPLYQAYNSNEAGNFQGASFRNVYGESALSLNPVNGTPFGDTGVSGLNAGRSTGVSNYSVTGFQNPSGIIVPKGTGSTIYGYCVIARDTTDATQTGCLPVMSRSENAAGSQVVKWPRVSGFSADSNTILYDLLRFPIASTNFAAAVFPYTGGCTGGSVGACGSVVVGQAQGAGFIQTFTDDTSVATTSYASVPIGTFGGHIPFWPSQGVFTLNSVITSQLGGWVTAAGLGGANLGLGQVGLISAYCTNTTVVNAYAVCLTEATPNNNAKPNARATLMMDGPASGGGMLNTKGRLNFGMTSGTVSSPRDVITITDSNFAKTRATQFTYRPLADALDAALCIDSAAGAASTVGVCIRAPVSLDFYINSIADGTSWKEQLLTNLKTFKVPITTNSQFTSTLATGTAPFVITSTTPVANLNLTAHPKVQACGATSTCANTAQTSAFIIQGSAPLVSGTPSTVVVTGISPAFTSTATYNCTVTDQTAGSALFYAKTSSSSITITGPNTVTDVVSYICVGN